MYYRNIKDERATPFLVPFLFGALIASPFAYQAGANRPNYYYQPPMYNVYPPYYYPNTYIYPNIYTTQG